jgi:NAD(P)-dependent dehydrogenase (short-subunit alcohol dehydrogenase family)
MLDGNGWPGPPGRWGRVACREQDPGLPRCSRAPSVGRVTDFRADGARVLITGGTSGLGEAMARALVDAGARVAVTGRDGERAHRAAGGIGAVGIGMDVRDEADVARGVDAAVDALGGLDVLVNNAGIGMRTVNPRFLTDPQPFWAVGPDGFRDVVATNLTGYFLVAREVVPRLLAAGGGRVVTISMNHATMNRRGFVPYGPSRAGAEALGRIIAADLAGSSVTANLLLPGGATATGMIPEGADPAHLLPADVMAAPIRWLCSPAAAGVHDQRIVATEFADWLAARQR